MPQLDPETLARALRWCAEAGTRTTEEAVRAALEPLSWADLLAAKATLADPPPRRGIGPAELAALARGPSRAPPAPAPLPAPGRRRRASPPRRAVTPRIRRARDRTREALAAPPPPPLLAELYREEGRAVLSQLLRRLGPSRPALAAALAAGWRRDDGRPAEAADLEPLLVHHGLLRSFAERERAALLHALRKAGGIRTEAARGMGLTPHELEAAVERLDLGAALGALREERRQKLLRRGTLAERARLFAAEEEALLDLGIAAQVEADLRRLLSEHLRALRAGDKRVPLGAALAESLLLPRAAVERMLARLGIDAAVRPAGRDAAPANARAAGASPGGRPRARRVPDRGARGRVPSPRAPAAPRRGRGGSL